MSADRPARPLVQGVLNCTPDSFYDGGRHGDVDGLIRQAHRMVEAGADWIDVGGESTRPGSAAVPPEEQLRRVLPVIRALSGLAPISIDTTSARVAAAAREAGATLLNDVRGLQDAELAAVSAEFQATVVMHSRGSPATMGRFTDYNDLVAEVRDWLIEAAGRAKSPLVYIDPGLGFAKTAAQSTRLLRHTDELVATGLPVLIGASRKSFIGAALGQPSPDDRLPGSLAAVAFAAAAGARVFRVHDVGPTVQLLDMLAAIRAA